MVDRKGFTLIEVIIVTTILALIMAALGGLFESGMKSWDRVNNQAELQENLRFALTTMVKDIRTAKKVNSGSTYEVLYLTMTDSHTANIIEYGLKDDDFQDEHAFNLQGSALYRAVDGGDKKPVANFIKELSFTYDANPENTTYVTIVITGSLPNGQDLTLKSGAEIKCKSLGICQ